MQVTVIKISQEINFNGMPTWIGRKNICIFIKQVLS